MTGLLVSARLRPRSDARPPPNDRATMSHLGMNMQSSNPGDARAILFSGHMIDAAGRAKPRFPPALEPAVSRAIRDTLGRLRPRQGDVGVCGGACGGDILFAEAILDRGVPVRLYLPLDEPSFLEQSVNFANDRWYARYRAVVAQATLFIAPEVLGPVPEGVDAFERTNLWMLDEAQRIGHRNVCFICVWNGEGGDGPGGTKHMMETVRTSGGNVDWIDIRKL